jgi:hypothetical protein
MEPHFQWVVELFAQQPYSVSECSMTSQRGLATNSNCSTARQAMNFSFQSSVRSITSRRSSYRVFGFPFSWGSSAMAFGLLFIQVTTRETKSESQSATGPGVVQAVYLRNGGQNRTEIMLSFITKRELSGDHHARTHWTSDQFLRSEHQPSWPRCAILRWPGQPL